MGVELWAGAWTIVAVKLDVKLGDQGLQHRLEVFFLDPGSDQWVLFDRLLVVLARLDACLQQLDHVS